MRLKNFLNNKNHTLKQAKFIKTIEGIGDILVFETKQRNRNKNVIQRLRRLGELIKKFLSIQKEDPDKFDQLLYSQEFFELYRENEKEAKLRLAFDPDKYLISFSTIVNQILRIHEASIEVKNDEISKFATYNLNWILADLSYTSGNNLLIEQLLKKLADITKNAIKYQDKSMYIASIHWYIKIVFNIQRQKSINFNLSYLELFDKYFFYSIQTIVSENQTSLFKGLVFSLVDGIQIPSHGEGMMWDYLNMFITHFKKLNRKYRIEESIIKLENSMHNLDTKEKLDNWLKNFKELKEIFEPYLKQDQRGECREKEVEIVDIATTQFKYNNLLEIVFAIGAYCLFKQKYEFIKYLWEYKQPTDADASWAGHDIIPNNVDQVIYLYFRKILFERKFDFWEDHRGSEIYYKEYFLLLLARVLQNIKINSKGKYEQLEKYRLPKLNIHRISDLEHSINDLVVTANKMKDQKKILSILGFDVENITELFDSKLIYFLKILKEKAQKKIEEIHKVRNISLDKVNKFKEDVIKGFNEAIVLRDIFKHYELYENRIKEKYNGKFKRFGINMVDDKAVFFDEWHVHYLDWGIDYGSKYLASGENSDIIEKIANNCKEEKGKDIDKILNKFNDLSNIIIFAINLDLFEFFKDSNNFIFKWSKNSPQLDIRGFEGWYIFKEKYIPVFSMHQEIINKQILVLNKIKLGKLIQILPLNKGESEDLMKDIFYMNIQSLSEIPEFTNRIIKDSPKWLKKIGDEKKQREHLQEKVSIQIYERFRYIKNSEFQGYSLNLERNNLTKLLP